VVRFLSVGECGLGNYVCVFVILLLTTNVASGAELVSFGPDLCGSGQMFLDGACVDVVRGSCPNGAYKTNINPETYSAPTLRTACIDTYTGMSLPDFMHAIYNGILVDFGATLCGSGYAFVNGKCERRAQGKCPSGFNDVMADANTLQPLTAGVCADGYSVGWLNENCATKTEYASLCGVLCDADYIYTTLGTCATVCTNGASAIKTDSGVTVPLYAQRQGAPSLNVELPDGMCYGILLPGASDGAININYDNMTYHTAN